MGGARGIGVTQRRRAPIRKDPEVLGVGVSRGRLSQQKEDQAHRAACSLDIGTYKQWLLVKAETTDFLFQRM